MYICLYLCTKVLQCLSVTVAIGISSSIQYMLSVDKTVTMQVSNEKVFCDSSKIEGAGRGLFAKQAIKKGEVVCTYGGQLVDGADAAYMDPTFIVSWQPGKGFKLLGDDIDGDLGHFANSIHPDNQNIVQNAKFNLDTRHKKVLEYGRARFDIVAKTDIAEGEEIIVNYGAFYWAIVDDWTKKGSSMIKSQTCFDRDARANRRRERSLEAIQVMPATKKTKEEVSVQ